MQGNIEKTPKNIENYKKQVIFYKNARTGFSEILKSIKEDYGDYTLLLPGYIGYSPNEGSGIYDPVVENKINHIFYKMNSNIEVDIEDFKRCIKKENTKIVVLIVHYFGYIDSNIKEILEISNENNAIIIEDCAHALYTDFVDNSCGNFSDFSIYSLHKMLPYCDGGMIRINKKKTKLKKQENFYNILEYDFNAISQKRKENAKIIEDELKNTKGIKLLRPSQEYQNQTPQTYPVIILEKDKDMMYHTLNEMEFGVVSLYHTMIKPLQKEEFKDINEISHKVLNLPIHQDAEKDSLIEMCNIIKRILGD